MLSCSEKPDIEYELSRDCYNHYKAKSYKVALSVCEESADHGDVQAMWYIATTYYYGLDKQGKNAEKSFAWYLRAAEAGLAKAQRFVGESYLYADGVDEDFSLAYEWLNKAAKQQDMSAEFAIAIMFLDGKGRNKDTSSAIAWFKKAASKEHIMAINNLAWIYSTSSHKMFRSPKKALFWANQLPVSTDSSDMTIDEKEPSQLSKDSYLYFDTQAAAYALSKDFNKAVELQQQAIALLPSNIKPEDLSGYEQRLEFYQQEKPWIDETIK